MRKAKTDITPENTEHHPDIAEPKSTRPSRKRKDNPVLIKYEINDPTTNLKIEELEEDKTPEGPAKFDKNNKKNFQHIYDTIREMRKDKTAAVDTYGCHRNADPTAPKDVQNFQTLCSLLISVQNRDESTAAAVERLKKFGLSAEKMAKTSEAEILEVMGGVNFNKKKATFIKSAAEIIMDKYKGKVPETLEEILEFPGVGNKIGILLMAVAHDAVVGIGVDTHVHRISNRLGWAKTKTPDETRLELQSFVPRDDWGDINHWMVGFGQQICLPINPKCQDCKLSDICLEGKRNMRYYKGKVKVEETDIKVTKKTKKNKKDDIEVKEEIIEVKQEETGYEPSMVSTQVSEMVTVTFSPQDEEGKGKKKKVQKRKTMCVERETRTENCGIIIEN